MTRNITLKLDAELLTEAKVLAVQSGMSVSALLTDLLESRLRQVRQYDRARGRALRRLEAGLDFQWEKPVSRDELHGR
jgi:hypothetical protein